MHTRTRKVATAKAVAEAPSNPEVTDDAGEERWAGDPNEEPAPPAVPMQPTPAAKDRHPMPWGLVINDTLNLDVKKTLDKLTKELQLGDGATEYGTVLKAVDQSSKNLYLAGCLARKAKNDDAAFAASLDMRYTVLRAAAVDMLESEVRQKIRSKAPTLQDIEDRMLHSWPDEVISIRARKAEMHGAFRAIEGLEVAWRERCQSLRTLAAQFKHSGT